MKDRFHKNRHRIWLSNTWSRYWYVTKFFKTDYEKIGFCAAIVSLFWSLLRLKFASSQALPNTPFIFKLPLDYGGWFFSYLLLGFGLFKLTVDLKSWTRTQLGGKRPDEKFHLSISNFQSSKTEFLSESDTGGSQLVRLEDFVADRVQDNGYLYITVKFGETLNHMAYSKDSEAHFVQNKIVEFDWQFYRSAAAKKIERGILDNSNSRVELRVALEIDSKVKTADLVNFVNGYKVSLRKLNFDNNRVIATCGRTSYFTSSLTNDMFCKQMLSNNSIDTLKWDFRKHYPATQFGNDGFFKINKLSDSHDVSNHVGSVVLAVSSDNFPILCRQGKNANINANKLVASGSGSLEWGDLKRAIEFAGEQDFTFDKFVRFGMARELFEECGLVDQHRITAA